MTFDRDQLIEDYIQQLIEGMDFETMELVIHETLEENLSGYTDEELIKEIELYDPELLEDIAA